MIFPPPLKIDKLIAYGGPFSSSWPNKALKTLGCNLSNSRHRDLSFSYFALGNSYYYYYFLLIPRRAELEFLIIDFKF